MVQCLPLKEMDTATPVQIFDKAVYQKNVLSIEWWLCEEVGCSFEWSAEINL